MNKITLNGQETTVENFCASVEMQGNVADTHSSLYADFSEGPDGIGRAWRVAMVMSGNSACKLAPRLSALATMDETIKIAELAHPVFAALYAANREFYNNFSDSRYGEDVALPADLDARKAALPVAMAALQADAAAARARAEAMPETLDKTAALALADLIDELVEGADESVRFADGSFTVPLTDAEVNQRVFWQLATYQGAGGLSEKEAQAKLDEEYGTTLEARRLAFGRLAIEHTCIGSVGTSNGSALCAEAEIAAGAAAVKLLDGLTA